MVRELLYINFSPNSSRFYILVLKMCGLNCVRSMPSHAPHFKPRYPEMVGLQQMVQCYTCFSNCSLNIIQITFTPFLPLLYWLQVLTSLVMVLNLVLDFLWQGMPSGWRPRNEIRVINISGTQCPAVQARRLTMSCLHHVSTAPYLTHLLPPPQMVHHLEQEGERASLLYTNHWFNKGKSRGGLEARLITES